MRLPGWHIGVVSQPTIESYLKAMLEGSIICSRGECWNKDDKSRPGPLYQGTEDGCMEGGKGEGGSPFLDYLACGQINHLTYTHPARHFVQHPKKVILVISGSTRSLF